MNQVVCILQRELCDLYSTLDRKFMLGVPARTYHSVLIGLVRVALHSTALAADHQYAADRCEPV